MGCHGHTIVSININILETNGNASEFDPTSFHANIIIYILSGHSAQENINTVTMLKDDTSHSHFATLLTHKTFSPTPIRTKIQHLRTSITLRVSHSL